MGRILINTISDCQIIKTSSILYGKAEGSYTRLVLINSKDILVSRNLLWLENTINSTNFIRLHKSYLVNMEYISHIFQARCMISLFNGNEIPYSKHKTKQLMEALLRFSNE